MARFCLFGLITVLMIALLSNPLFAQADGLVISRVCDGCDANGSEWVEVFNPTGSDLTVTELEEGANGSRWSGSRTIASGDYLLFHDGTPANATGDVSVTLSPTTDEGFRITQSSGDTDAVGWGAVSSGFFEGTAITVGTDVGDENLLQRKFSDSMVPVDTDDNSQDFLTYHTKQGYAPGSGPSNLVISRVCDGCDANGSEWVEVFNPTGSDRTVTELEEGANGSRWSGSRTISSGDYLLFHDGTPANASGDVAVTLTPGNDEGFRITQSSGDTDAVGWGTASSGFFEGTAVTAGTHVGDENKIQRKIDSARVPQDTDDNSQDFLTASAKDFYLPRGALGATVRIDSPPANHDTSIQNIRVSGSSTGAETGDTVEVFVNSSLVSSANVQSDSSWTATGVTLQGIGDQVKAELDTDSVDPIADSDVITVNYNDTNLVFPYNWDMEDEGPDGPDSTGTAGNETVDHWPILNDNDDYEWDSTTSFQGDASMYVDLESGISPGEQVQSETVPVRPDEPYEVRAQFNLAGSTPSDALVKLWVRWYDDSGSLLSTSKSSVLNPATTSWDQITFSPSSPSNAARARMVIETGESGSGQAFNIDNAEFVLDSTVSITSPQDGHDTDVSSITVSGTASGSVDVGDAVAMTVDGQRVDTASVASDSTWTATSVELNGSGDSVVANLLETASLDSDTVARDTITVNKVDIATLLVNEVSPVGAGSSPGVDWVELRVQESGLIPSGYTFQDDKGNDVDVGVISEVVDTGSYIVIHDTSGTSETSDQTASNDADAGDTYWDLYDETINLDSTSGAGLLKNSNGTLVDALIWDDLPDGLNEGTALDEAITAGEWSQEGNSRQAYDAVMSDGSGNPRAYYRDSRSSDTEGKRGWDYLPASATLGDTNDDSTFNQDPGTGTTKQNFDGVLAAGASSLTFEITYQPSVDFGAGTSRNGIIDVRIPAGFPDPSLDDPTAEGFVQVTDRSGDVSDSFTYQAGNDTHIVLNMASNFVSTDTVALRYGDQSGGGPGLSIPSGAGQDTFVVRTDPSGNNVARIPDSEQPSLVRNPVDTVAVDPNSASNPAGSVDLVTAEARDAQGNVLAGADLTYRITKEPTVDGASVTDTRPSSGKTLEGDVEYDFATDNTAGTNALFVFQDGTPSHGDTFTDITTELTAADSLVINEFLPQPSSFDHDGDGSSQSDDEYIEIFNASNGSVNVEGETVSLVKAGTTLTLEGSIPPRGYLVYYAGNASGGNDEIYVYDSAQDTVSHSVLPRDDLGTIGNNLSDGGDTIELLDRSGGITDRKAYDGSSADRAWSRKIDGWEILPTWTSDGVPHPGPTNQKTTLEGPSNAEFFFTLPDTSAAADSFSSTVWVEDPSADTVTTFSSQVNLSASTGTVSPSSPTFQDGVFSDSISIDTTDSATITVTATYDTNTTGTGSLRIVRTNTPPSVRLLRPDTDSLVSGDAAPGTYVIADDENDPGTVTAEISDDSGSTWDTTATLSGEIASISTSTEGETHTFNWDTLSDLGTVEDTRVKFRLRAFDGQDTSGYDTSGAFTVDNRAPPRVRDLSSTAALATPDTGPSLFWSRGTDDAANYRVYRADRTADTSLATFLDTAPVTADTQTYLDASATQGDSYFYYVIVEDTAGNESDSSNVTTPPNVRISKTQDDTGSHRPGDTIVYTIEYANNGFGPTGNIELVDAIPDTTVLSDTATVLNPPPDATIEYSTDGGSSWQSSSYPRGSIDRIRWTITEDVDPQKAGTTGRLRFRVRLQ